MTLADIVGIEEAKIENPGVLLENLSKGIKREQVLREKIQNALDNGATKIHVDVDPVRRLIGIWKMIFRDNGVGMTAEQVRQHINKFAQHAVGSDHFGVGGRLTSIFWNVLGVVYRTFTSPEDGTEARMVYERKTGRIGLAETEDEDGDVDSLYELDKSDMWKFAKQAGHGTDIILEGMTPEDNTFLPPEEMQGGEWAYHQHLNHHYFGPIKNNKGKLAEVKVRHFHSSDPNKWPRKGDNTRVGAEMRTIRGMQVILEASSEKKGSFTVDGVKFYWFLLKQKQKRDPSWRQKPHVAALNNNELFHQSFGVKALRDFGLRMIGYRTVIYVEPPNVEQDVTRQRLVKRNRPIPWGSYRKLFQANMPAVLRKADIAECEARHSLDPGGEAESGGRTLSVIDKLRKLFQSPKDFVKSATGDKYVEALDPTPKKPGKGGKPNPNAKKRKTGKRKVAAGLPVEKKDGETRVRGYERHAAVAAEVPSITWIFSEQDVIAQELVDRGATITSFKSNEAVVNGSYYAITQLVDRLVKEYNPPSRQMVIGVVREVVDELLAWHVYRQRVKLGMKGWNRTLLDEACSDVTLTSLLDGCHLSCLFQARKRLGHAMGKGDEDVFSTFIIEDDDEHSQAEA